ncbi:MAG: tRNA (adenosine(37)-N6)-dimethylallyltransferase MiaA [Clostridia bacterium]|nr:tRNA (adenosine(37)-N6)-dimethylallyltransferase MiaA [Clostridia bacterium]
MSRKVIFIVGPTASGKTALSIALAKEFDGEIISADSMQIYKGIHIASAAPDMEEMGGIPHHLLEFLELTEEFSVADYVSLAREKIDEILARSKQPIIVGGTGLYISALLDNTKFTDIKTDPELRKRLENEFDSLGGEEMLKRLSKFDPESANRLHKSDKRRIIRCFEIYETTGKTLTRQNELSHIESNNFDAVVLGITYKDREELYDRINRRVDIMLKNGLLDEARKTFEMGNSKGEFQAIGHKELYGYLKGECTLEEATELLKMQTRRYAKRQLTWFRRDGRINWLYPDETENLLKKAKEFI